MYEVNYNKDEQIYDMEMLMRTPLYVVRHKFNGGMLYFMQCRREEAKRMIEDNHYSHKFIRSFGKVNIGVYTEGRLVGVASYGNVLDFNNVYDKDVIELNRMWVSDELGKNAESILISVSLKMLKRLKPELKYVQSFSDSRLGCGIMYQSANFKYYGYRESEFVRCSDGSTYHKMSLETVRDLDEHLKKVEKILDGEDKTFIVRSYRYIYLFDKNYVYDKEELEYPKNESFQDEKPNAKFLRKVLLRDYLVCVALDKDVAKIEEYYNKYYDDFERSINKYRGSAITVLERYDCENLDVYIERIERKLAEIKGYEYISQEEV